MKKRFTLLAMGLLFSLAMLSSCSDCAECTATHMTSGQTFSDKKCGSSDKIQKFMNDWEVKYGGGNYSTTCTWKH